MRFELLSPVPAVDVARQLRQIPLFGLSSVDELFRISMIARQVRYDENVVVQERGARAEYIQVLVQGRLRIAGTDGEGHILSPPAMLGFQEVLTGTTLRDTATTELASVALVMPAEDFRELLSANIELAQGVFRMLLDSAADGTTASSRAFHYETKTRPLTTVEKVMYLQTLPILVRATGEELYELAGITREAPLVPGSTVFSVGESPFIVLPLSGELSLENEDGSTSRGLPGAAIGIHETLSGTEWKATARVSGGGQALWIDREPLFDLLSDRIDLLQGVFDAVFRWQNEP
ncbi:MAG TPA: cyclic nucleotide-binding domain-containing protein [Vicinamibacteria bacterium]|nr:cyclic nucleotide-binding domain-containing protein [Vicinamibacteria bacterium]